jgi:hypothetical protein
MNKAIATSAILGVAVLMIGAIKANAQTANVTTISGLNAQNIDNAHASVDRILNIAKLHNATSTELDVLNNHLTIMNCVSIFFFNEAHGIPTADTGCNDLLTGFLIHKELGSNQTMINIAKAYLKINGIQ